VRRWITEAVPDRDRRTVLLSLEELLAWLKRCEEVATEPSMHELPLEQLGLLHPQSSRTSEEIAYSAFRIITWTNRSFREGTQKIGTIRGTFNIRPRALVGSMARGFLYLVAMLEPCTRQTSGTFISALR